MKRKVLFLIESLAGGGAEKVLTTLVQHIDKDKFDVTVCAISGGGQYETDVRSAVNYKAILQEPRNNHMLSRVLYAIKHHLVYKWLPLSWVYRLFVPQGSAMEVAYIEGFSTKLLSYSTNRKASKYAWVHTDLQNNHWTTSIFGTLAAEVEAYNKYSKICCVSDTARQGFQNAFRDVTSPIITIYNPISTQNIITMASEKIESFKHPIRLVTVGRLVHQKGYDRLVRVINQLVNDGFDFELWILGTGDQEEELKQYIHQNNLEKYIKLLGFQPNPYKYIIQCDLFVCSSRAEGYSTAVTEALILGLPVVTTDCSGMAELLKDGECGIITENDETALYEGIKRLLADPISLEHYRNKAIERGKDFTIERLMGPIEKLLAE